jgi:DNA-binding NtrC family response regulator
METKQGLVFVVVGDQSMREEAVQQLSGPERTVETPASWEAALELAERAAPDLVLTAFEPRDSEGFEAVERLRALAPNATVVVMMDAIEAPAAVSEAIRLGADHCLTRPISREALAALLERALRKAVAVRKGAQLAENVAEQFHLHHFKRTVGSHPSMQRLLERALQAAQTKATVLICGETGTGKELIASGIHENSKRREGPLVKVNCAALAESILESELFGHEKGAFTGAVSRRRGKFELAHRGTLFLDEVSEIPLSIQVKLLRFLQDREIERVGGNEVLNLDVRVIAATNRDLSLLVEENRFREDLYYRLNVIRLDVPPLRARPSDIPLLAEHFLRQYAEEHERDVTAFTREAIDALIEHPWPGNVRALQNAIEQAVVMCEQDTIDVEDLPFAAAQQEVDPLRLLIPGVTMAEIERYAVVKTLEAVGWSTSRAAAILQISKRTIQYRLKQWHVARSNESEDYPFENRSGKKKRKPVPK